MRFFFILFLSLLTIESPAQSWSWINQEILGDAPQDHSITADDSGNVYLISGWGNLLKVNKSGNLLWNHGIYINNYLTYGWVYSVSRYAGGEYMTGYFSDTLICGLDTLNSTKSGIFLVKSNTNGTYIWAKQSMTKGNGNGAAYSIATDYAGNAFITGSFKDTLSFDADTIKTTAASGDIFIVKFASNGNALWAKNAIASSGSFGNAYSIAVDKYGNSYITGYYYGSLTFGSIVLNNASIPTMFLAKYDSVGNVRWATSASGAASIGNSVAVDVSGNAYVTGYFYSGAITFGSYTSASAVNNTPFLVKFTSGGSVDWAIEGVDLDVNGWQGVSVATDSLMNGYIILEGNGAHSINNKLEFGIDTFRFTGSADFSTIGVIVQFDSSGNLLCNSIYSDGEEDDGDGVAVSPSGKYVFLGGDIAVDGLFGMDTIFTTMSGEMLFIANWQPCNKINDGVNKINTDNKNILVYPSPSNGIFTIAFSHAELVSASQTIIEIYNVLGKKVYSSSFTFNYSLLTINLNSQPNGIYFYRVVSENGELIGKGKLIIEK